MSADDDSQITVESVIEDIVISNTSINAIQCKYHGTQLKFTLGLVYEPILQMMKHFHNNSHLNVNYRLYAYFPDQTQDTCRFLSNDDFETILRSKDKDLIKYITAIKDKINIDSFSKHFTLEFGKSLNDTEKDVYSAFIKEGIPKEDIETWIYPNAFHEIANLSIKHNENERKITKAELLKRLKKIHNTAISRWTLALKSKKKILETRRKQLKSNLSKNSRLRYFIISQESTVFDNVVNFIREYLEKYHFKPILHQKTPIFCLDCKEKDFDDIRIRIHKKGIHFVDGYIANYFDKDHFFREPISSGKKELFKIEFQSRLISFDKNYMLLDERKCDDLFIISDKNYDKLDFQDVNVEQLDIVKFQELKFLLGMSDSYE